MKVVSSYFDSEWSFAQYRITDTKKESKLGFWPDSHTLSIITIDGHFYQITFDPVSGGNCTLARKEDITTTA